MFKYIKETSNIIYETDNATRYALSDMLGSADDGAPYNNRVQISSTKTCVIEGLLQRIINFDITVVEHQKDEPCPDYKASVAYKSYTNEELNATTPEDLAAYYVTNLTSNDEWRRISIQFVKRGIRLFDIINEQVPASTTEKNIEISLQQNQYHRLIIRKHDNYVAVISNQELSNTIIAKLQLLPYIWWDKISKYPLALQLIGASFDADEEKMDAAIQAILKKYNDNQKDRVYTQLSEALKNATNNREEGLRHNVVQYERNVETAMNNLRSYQDQLKTYKAQLAGFKLEPQTDDTKLIDFLKNNKTCTLQGVRDGRIVLEIIAPVRSYADKDVDMWFRHPDRSNCITRNAGLAKVIKACFKDKEYTMYYGTKVYMPIDGSTSNWSSSQNLPNWLGNTHMVHYSCFGETRTAVQNSIRTNGDFIAAISQTIAACSTLVFTDSTVIEALSTDLRNNSNKKIFKDNKTGEMVSMDDIIATKEAEHAED